MTEAAKKCLWKADELHAHQRAFTQQFNPNSHLLWNELSRLAGMQRAHITFGRDPRFHGLSGLPELYELGAPPKLFGPV